MTTQFSARQWLLIDLANQLGHDKETLAVRLDEGRKILKLIQEGKRLPKMDNLGQKALAAIMSSLKGEPTGFIMGVDASSSGPQILSVFMGCEQGMKETGAIDGGFVPNMYSRIAKNFGSNVDRKLVKKACIPYVYGSDLAPEEVFGDQADAFCRAYKATVPGAYVAREKMLETWNPDADRHCWTAPDGFHADVPVKDVCQTKGTIDGHSFVFEYTKQMAKESGKANAANLTHTIDGMMVREVAALAMFNRAKVEQAMDIITDALSGCTTGRMSVELEMIYNLNIKHNYCSVNAVEIIADSGVDGASEKWLKAQLRHCELMLSYEPFEMLFIHDEYKAAPKHINKVREYYNLILSKLYGSSWLHNTVADLGGELPAPSKKTAKIQQAILNNDYALA